MSKSDEEIVEEVISENREGLTHIQVFYLTVKIQFMKEEILQYLEVKESSRAEQVK